MSIDETTEAPAEVRRDGQRVIVVNSQPEKGDGGLPPRRLRSLGAVQAHATDPTTGESRPRRGGKRGNPLLGILVTALPIALVAFGIRLLAERVDGFDRVAILASTGALVLVWLVGLAAAWRRLGPGNRDGRGGVWLARAIGLVIGAVAAVYLLLNTVSPLL